MKGTVKRLPTKPPTSLPRKQAQLNVTARRTPELVMAFVGAAGSGVTPVASAFASELKERFGYEIHHIKVSTLLRDAADSVGEKAITTSSKADKIENLQNIGNKLRQIKSADYLMKICVQEIAKRRHNAGGYPKSLAEELHYDALTGRGDKSAERKVHFVPYEGVAPRNLFRLFKHGIERKREGRVVERERKDAVPITQPPMDGFSTFEQVIVRELSLPSADDKPTATLV